MVALSIDAGRVKIKPQGVFFFLMEAQYVRAVVDVLVGVIKIVLANRIIIHRVLEYLAHISRKQWVICRGKNCARRRVRTEVRPGPRRFYRCGILARIIKIQGEPQTDLGKVGHAHGIPRCPPGAYEICRASRHQDADNRQNNQ